MQIEDLLYIKYESQEFIEIYITNYWMETTGGHVKYHRKKVGDEIYTHIQSQEEGKTERKYGTTGELNPKIDRKISSHKGPKDRCSKNNKPKKYT